jgi:hypothetical protein
MEPMKPMKPMEPMKPMAAQAAWWPEDLGKPDSTGSQNNLRYAYFDQKQRLAVDDGSGIKLYDTGGKRISGFAQAQGSGSSLRFTTDQGTIGVGDLKAL